MKRRGRRATALLVTGVIALTAAVAGYAYWTSTGEASGSVATGTTTPWEVTVSSASGGPLYPGGPAQTVQFNVANTSDSNQYLNGVTVSVADGWSHAACTKADFSLNGEPAGSAHLNTALTDTYGPHSTSSVPATVQVRLVESGAPQNDCKGVTVPLHFVAS